MIKHFIKHYFRYIAMALAFASISFMINACKVHASSQMQTFELNHYWAGNESPHAIFTSTNTLKNYGRGYLTFSFAIYRYAENSTFYIPTLSGVNVNTGDAIWACDVGTVSNDFSQDDFLKVNIYSVICDVNIGSQGIRSINLELVTNNYNWNIKSSTYATFTNDTTIDIQNYLTTINSTLANYIGTTNSLIASKIDQTNAYLQVLQTLLNTNVPSIVNSINSGNAQAHTDSQAQTNATNNINTTLNDSDTTNVSLDTLTGNTVDTGAISGLITIPLNLVASVITAFNGTCSPYNFGSLFGTNIVFPCIDIESFIGSFLWDTIDIMITGIFIFYISKKFLILFNKLIDLEKIRIGGTDFA